MVALVVCVRFTADDAMFVLRHGSRASEIIGWVDWVAVCGCCVKSGAHFSEERTRIYEGADHGESH